jgi:deoxycytidylate deaminase
MNEIGPPLTNYDLKAIRIAIAIATQSLMRHKHGASLFNKKRIFGIGFNQNKTHPIADEYYRIPHLHAELDCVLKSGIIPSGCSIAVARVNKRTKKLLISKPCEGCMQLLRDRKIKYVVYTTNGGINKIKL